MRAYYSPFGRVRMLAGDRALDLANTEHWRDGALVNFVPDYGALVDWCMPALLLSRAEADALHHSAKKWPAAVLVIHDDWLELRQLFKTWLGESAPRRSSKPKARQESTAFRALAGKLDATLHGVDAERLLGPSLSGTSPDLALPLQRSAAAILSLLLFPPEGRIAQCEADRCGGFFIDRSRSKPRRWCAMDSCGNRMKVAEFRARQRD